MKNDEKNSFQYTYSSKEQEEIKKIRQKYAPSEESKMERLRKLDKSVQKKASTAAIAVGVTGTLVFGGGMSCITVMSGGAFVAGIIIGVIGIAILSLAYPVYGITLKKERKRIASEVLKLADELIK